MMENAILKQDFQTMWDSKYDISMINQSVELHLTIILRQNQKISHEAVKMNDEWQFKKMYGSMKWGFLVFQTNFTTLK